MLYDRLDDQRQRAADRLERAFEGASGGTHQARSERDVVAARYAEQVARCDAVEHGLCFGRLDLDDDERRYVGRIGLFDEDGDYEPLLVDWRAPAARPFYVATAASPDGVRRRRHIRTVRREVVGLDDEVLDISAADPNRHEGLTGEAALLAAVNASRTGRMQDIVETIQAEQDRIIRSGLSGALVVQGGPGTGKTAVALHRAAYLLYTYREQLATRAVLLVGPNATFLRYIGQVLPSLGETSVVLATVADLYPGVRARREEPAEVAAVKGAAAMADVLAAAVADRQRVPDDAVEIRYDQYAQEALRLDRATCVQARQRARASRLPHNQARSIFERVVVAALARQVAARLSDDILVDELIGSPEIDARLLREILGEGGPAGEGGHGPAGQAGARPVEAEATGTDPDAPGGAAGPGAADPRVADPRVADPRVADPGAADPGAAVEPIVIEERDLFDEGDLAEIRRELAADPAVRAALDELWPVLTPQRLLAELYASDERLAAATAGSGAAVLDAASRDLLRRAPGGGWSAADVPLLDEAAELLGVAEPDAAGTVARRADAARAEYARGVLEILEGSRSLDDEEDPELLMAQHLIDSDRLADRHRTGLALTVAERAAADRSWAYGHVVVDEAQELSEMAWRVLMRRCPSRSMTLVGDVAQTGDLAGSTSWERVLRPYLGERWRLERLTVNYRMPAEVMDVAAGVLAEIDPALEPPRSVRYSSVEPWCLDATPETLAELLAGAVERESAAVGDGRVGVLVPAGRLAEVGGALRTAVAGSGGVPAVAVGEDPELESRVVVLGVRQAKGLEFDSVLVVDPGGMVAESPHGLRDLYVALTRATQRLGVVACGPLPAGLGRLRPLLATAPVVPAAP